MKEGEFVFGSNEAGTEFIRAELFVGMTLRTRLMKAKNGAIARNPGKPMMQFCVSCLRQFCRKERKK